MKRRLILLVSLLLLSVGAADSDMLRHARKAFRTVGGAPLALHSSSGATGTAMSDATTRALTLSSTLSNGYIVVAVTFWDSATTEDIVSCSYDGVAMTELVDFAGPGANNQIYIFGLSVGSKAAGTYNATFDVSNPIGEYSVIAAAYNGVHQTTSTGTAATAANVSESQTTSSIAVTSNVGELIFDVLLESNGEIATPTGTGHVELYEGAPVAQTCGAFGEMPGVATSTTVTWTFVGQAWGAAGFALKPAP